jgi:hypothetical protein
VIGNKAWASEVARLIEAGDRKIPGIAWRWAEEVLGRKILRGGKHAQRPDVKDRQAGQAAEHARDDDDGMVQL